VVYIKVLSLDGATKVTGYALFEDSQLIQYGLVNLSDISDTTERMNTMKNLIIKLIDEYKVEKIIMEDIQQQRGNVKGFKTLAKLQGILTDIFFEREIPVVLIPSTTWKSKVGINTTKKREFQKNQSIEIAKEKFNIQVCDDISDAILMGFSQLNKG
jgi:Holliday junction resolvasome RuvABC endonuclease subunit